VSAVYTVLVLYAIVTDVCHAFPSVFDVNKQLPAWIWYNAAISERGLLQFKQLFEMAF